MKSQNGPSTLAIAGFNAAMAGTSAMDESASLRDDDDCDGLALSDDDESCPPVSDEARVTDATARRDALARSTRCTPRVMIERAVIEFADIVPPKCATTTVMEMDGNARSAVSISASLISRSPKRRDGLDDAQTVLTRTPDTSHGRSRFFHGATLGPPTTRAAGMFNPFSCCCGESEESRRMREEDNLLQATRARQGAAAAAEERQRAYDASAVGRAAQKSQQKMRQQAQMGDRHAQQVVSDWNSA